MHDFQDEGYDEQNNCSATSSPSTRQAMVHHDWFESLIQTTGMPVTDELRILLIETMFARLPLEHRTKLMARLDARMRRDFIRDLPIELSTRILSYLPLTDITQSVSLVSRQWWSVTRDRSLWHSLFLQQGWQLDMDRWAYYNTLPVEMNPDIVMLEQYSDTQQLQQSFVPMNRDTAMASRKKAMDRAWNASTWSPKPWGGTQPLSKVDSSNSSELVALKRSRSNAGSLVAAQPLPNIDSLNQQLANMSVSASTAGRAPTMVRGGGDTVPRFASALSQPPVEVDQAYVSQRGQRISSGVQSSMLCGEFSFAEPMPALPSMFQPQLDYAATTQQRHYSAQRSTRELFSSRPGLPSSTNGHGLFDNPDSSFFEAAQQRRFRGKLYRRQPVINANFLPPLTDSPPRYLSPENLAPYESAPPIAPVDWLGMYKHQYQLETNWVHGNCKISRWPMAHTESIYCLQFDRHNRLFTGSRDHTIKVWYLADNSEITPLTTLSAHTGSVLTLQVDGDTLISGSSDATICVWDLKTQTVQHTLRHSDSVLSLRFNDKWLVTSSKDRTVRVWERDTNYATSFELRGHRVAINAVQLVGDIVVSASGDRTIKVWDIPTRSCILTLPDHSRGVACLDFDGKYITSGSSDRSIRVWNIETGQCERTIANAHTDLVRTIMFNREMGIIVSGSYDESIKIWSFETGELLHKIKNAHTSRVFKLMFDRSRIVSCSHDKAVAVMDFGVDVINARLFC